MQRHTLQHTLMLPLGGGGAQLPLDVLHFLGDGRYLQLAMVSKDWRSLSTQLFPGRKTAVTAVMSAKLLAWARDSGCAFTARSAALAAGAGHLEALQWLRANGCAWDEGVCAAAAKAGHLAVLQWARAQGCPWDIQTCLGAAEEGHVHVLQWAWANGFPWNVAECGPLETWLWYARGGRFETCAAAARSGNLHLLQSMRAAGCSWDAQVRIEAAQHGHQHVLQWAIDNGCPAP
jgi:hypothetical protein